MRDVAGDPPEDVGVSRERLRHLPQMKREPLPAQERHARGVAVLPGEVDTEEPHTSGRAMLPLSTVTAEPPTRTRVTAPARTWSSTRSLPARPRPSPCSDRK